MNHEETSRRTVMAVCVVVATCVVVSVIATMLGCCGPILPFNPPWCDEPGEPTPAPTMTPTRLPTNPPTPTPSVSPTITPTWQPTYEPEPTPAPASTFPPSTEDAVTAGWELWRITYPFTTNCEEAKRLNKTLLFAKTDMTGRSGFGVYWRYVTVDCRECDGTNPFSVCVKPEVGVRMGAYECVHETYICDAPEMPGNGDAYIGVSWSKARGLSVALVDENGEAVWIRSVKPPVPIAVSRSHTPGDPMPRGWANGWTEGATATLVDSGVMGRGSPVWCPLPQPTPKPALIEGLTQGNATVRVNMNKVTNPENGIVAAFGSADKQSCFLIRLSDKPDSGDWMVRAYLCWGDGPAETHWASFPSWPGVPLGDEEIVTFHAAWAPLSNKSTQIRISDSRGAVVHGWIPWKMAVSQVETARDAEGKWSAGRLGDSVGEGAVGVIDFRGESMGWMIGCH